MKITLLTVGSTGDVRPFVLLGRELQSRGHNVTLATFSLFEQLVCREGIRFFPLSGDAEKLMASIMNPDTNGITYLPRLEKALRKVAPGLIQDMSDSCLGADAMVCNFFGSVYYSIAEKHHIPCIQTHFSPLDPNRSFPISSFRNQHLGSFVNAASYRLGYLLIGLLEHHFLTSWRKENALSSRHPRSHPDYQVWGHDVPVIYAASPLLLSRPKEWNSHIRMSGFWLEDPPHEATPPADLEAFLAKADHPIYIGFGSMNSGNMNRLMTIVLRALHASGLSAVVNNGWSGSHLKSTRKVFFTNYVPHDWLFPRVRAVVHHGGAGTVAAGLRWGRPTLVIPFAGDQPFWGNQVFLAGCGPKPLPRESLTVHRMTRALIDLVSHPDYRLKAEALSKGLAREHGVATAADMIEEEIRSW